MIDDGKIGKIMDLTQDLTTDELFILIHEINHVIAARKHLVALASDLEINDVLEKEKK